MRRADRLFQIIQLLRKKKVVTALQLAGELGVSERTIYRDIRDLMESGLPIEGEAGVGYRMLPGFDLPPLMFSEEEIEALVLGARIVESWADPELVRAASTALSKIEDIVPERLQTILRNLSLFSLNFKAEENIPKDLSALRFAIREKRKILLDYTRADGLSTTRTIRPLCLAFTAPLWLLSAWCELRDDFRNFRADRIIGITVLEESFEDETGRTLDDFLALEKSKMEKINEKKKGQGKRP